MENTKVYVLLFSSFPADEPESGWLDATVVATARSIDGVKKAAQEHIADIEMTGLTWEGGDGYAAYEDSEPQHCFSIVEQVVIA
jgi:hypothetical protein